MLFLFYCIVVPLVCLTTTGYITYRLAQIDTFEAYLMIIVFCAATGGVISLDAILLLTFLFIGK